LEVISHRGNIHRENEKENHPDQIKKALNLFRVEVDVWLFNDEYYLGHNGPEYKVKDSFFDKNMLLHCKNLEAVKLLSRTDLNWFWHESDKITITNYGEIWCFPENYIENGITVLWGDPINHFQSNFDFNIKGICTDYPLKALDYLDKEKKI
jgi:hypothetical protein